MYNLKNLNDYEYEVLYLDVMSKMLKKKQVKDGKITLPEILFCISGNVKYADSYNLRKYWIETYVLVD